MSPEHHNKKSLHLPQQEKACTKAAKTRCGQKKTNETQHQISILHRIKTSSPLTPSSRRKLTALWRKIASFKASYNFYKYMQKYRARGQDQMSKIRAEEWDGEIGAKATHWWSKYWKLSDTGIKRTMINKYVQNKIKWQVRNYTRELGPVLKRKGKGKNQIKIVNLKNTIARTDSLWHDEEVDKSSPHKVTIKPVRTVKSNHFSTLKIPAYNKQKENSGEMNLSTAVLLPGAPPTVPTPSMLLHPGHNQLPETAATLPLSRKLTWYETVLFKVVISVTS